METLSVLITGTSSGMGVSIAKKYLKEGHLVYGIDAYDSVIKSDHYTHIKGDIRTMELPDLIVHVLINNAGTENSKDDMSNNWDTTYRMCVKYAVQNPNIKSVVNVCSMAATTGSDYPVYCASKAAIKTYTRWLANEIAPRAAANSLSPGGVYTPMNFDIWNTDLDVWNAIMKVTPLKKWCEPEEMADWCYFLTNVNKSMTGQDVIVDNGETVNRNFVTIPEYEQIRSTPTIE